MTEKITRCEAFIEALVRAFLIIDQTVARCPSCKRRWAIVEETWEPKLGDPDTLIVKEFRWCSCGYYRTEEEEKPYSKWVDKPKKCPKCGAEMRLVKYQYRLDRWPSYLGWRRIWRWKCPRCGHEHEDHSQGY